MTDGLEYGFRVTYQLKSFDLGTPQGGVLSPIFFNILMDKIAWHSFPRGMEIVIYADDILIQCDSFGGLTTALQHLEDVPLYTYGSSCQCLKNKISDESQSMLFTEHQQSH